MLNIADRFEVVEDKPVLHRAETIGPRVVRTQVILDKETGTRTTVNFWANFDGGSIIRVS